MQFFSDYHFGGLWQHSDFLKYWGSQTVSQLGTQISLLAIPLTAAITLDASPFEMGLIAAAETSPFLLFGLLVGIFADRHRRRPVLLWCDIGRAALLLLIPTGWILGALSIPLLIIIAFLIGVFTVFFEVSNQSYLPSLVDREQLIEGNGKIESTRAGAQVFGPGIAGGLVQILTAPVAIITDAISFLISALLLKSIEREESFPESHDSHSSMIADIREGIAYVARNQYLRPVAVSSATTNFFFAMMMALLVIYATRDLGISAGLIGLVFAGGSTGFLVGAIAARRVASQVGVGATITGGAGVTSVGLFLIPAASGSTWLIVALLILGLFVASTGAVIYNITQVSLRQAITPPRLLGRMNATMRFLISGVMPLGNLAGGGLGSVIGIRQTLAVAALGGILAVLWLLLSELRSLKEYPVAHSDFDPL